MKSFHRPTSYEAQGYSGVAVVVAERMYLVFSDMYFLLD